MTERRKTRDQPPSSGRWHAIAVGLSVVSALAMALPAAARVKQLPVSVRQPVRAQSTVEKLEMPTVDVARLRAQDELTDNALTPGPTRFAAAIEVSYDLESSGTWEALDDGSRLWRLRISSPGALSLNLGFRRFALPFGAGLWIYDAAGERIEGPYTWRDRAPDGQLWTSLMLGDEIVLELHLPAGVGDARLELSAVNHGYRFFGEKRDKQGSCNIDVVCDEVAAFSDQVRAVARYTRSGTILCTGNLLNNTALDFRPLFLTAEHCGITALNASSVVVYWNHESPSCGQLGGGSLADNQSGATFLASDNPSDFLLIELDQQPDPSSNVYHAGWDASGAVPQRVVGIHHPTGDEKAAAFEGDPLVSTDIGSGGETHWQVTAWDLGTTEPGSSGSCIFDQTHKGCVGTLTGGFASCSAQDQPDFYGKLALAWTGGGSDSTRLSNWLDPVGGGTNTFLAGADPTDGGDDDDGDDDDDDDDGGGEPFDCVADSNTMCLTNGRFQVTMDWRDFKDATGPGVVVPAGDDHWGVFWFFTEMNGEVLVKVLDGCDFNNRYWVFAAAATNVEYTLTVTDSTTGDSRTYGNELGAAAPAVVDTTAFATCP